MRAGMLAFTLVALTSPARPQKLQLQAILDQDPRDSVCVVSEVSVGLKLTHVKPSTIYRFQAKTMSVVPDEKSKDWRCLPKGQMGLLVNTRTDPYAVVQPHLFFEIAGLPTHLSTKMAIGVMDREMGFACGIFVGQYMRRVDDYGDVSFRAKQFEAGWHRGLYLFADRPGYAFFFSYAKEKTFQYFDTSLGWKMGETLRFSPALAGLQVQTEFESYLGAGGGLAYRVPSGKFSASLSYLVPGLNEINRERAIGLIVENGLLLRIRAQWF